MLNYKHMQPNNPMPQQPDPNAAPTSYLDSISTPIPQKTLNPVILWGLIGGVLLLAVTMVLTLANSGGNPKESLTTYQLRVEALEEVSVEAQENIQTSELRIINSNLSLVLTDAKQGVAEFQTEKVDKKSEAFQTVAAETEELKSNLDEARLNAIYDRTYARELRYEITSLRSQMGVIYDKSRSSKLKEYLEATNKNLKNINNDLSAYNAD